MVYNPRPARSRGATTTGLCGMVSRSVSMHVGTCLTRVVLPALAPIVLALMSVGAFAGEIDTEHLFAFAVGTDIGEVGDKELEGGTLARFAKRTGSYGASSSTLEAEFTPLEDFRLSFGPALARYDIAGVAGLDDRHQWAFEGASLEMRYRLLRREGSSFGLAINAEPHWERVDEISGAPVDRTGVALLLAIDKELAANTIAVANLLYDPEVIRSRATGAWSREAVLGIAAGVMVQIHPSGFFVGGEARYLRRYEALSFEAFAGHALFVGPSMFATLSERCWISAGWGFQLAGHAVGELGPLDLTNFERQQAIFKFGVNF